jgi:bacteriochlorophyll 4-vinyl reductase
MRDAGVGRVLVASLHQSIADLLPARLVFYENWLKADGLREGTIGLAPLSAVLSFLRQEGEIYDQVMVSAGEYAADWTVDSMAPALREAISMMPLWLRARWLLTVAAGLVHSSYQGSRARARVRRGVARIELRQSVLCSVREPVKDPLCRFYAAAFTRIMTRFSLPCAAAVAECRATQPSASLCVVSMPINRRIDAAPVPQA